MKMLAVVITIVFGANATAADYEPLQGTYKVGGKTLYDPPESEAQDTHFYVDLEGSAARDLYDALKAKPQAGLCGEPGDLTKRAGGVQCTKVGAGKEYHCAFGVELQTQRVVVGVVC